MRHPPSSPFREAWNGGLNICLNLLSVRAPKSNSVVDAFTLNNQTPKSWTARVIFLLAQSSGLRCKCVAAHKYKMRMGNIVGLCRRPRACGPIDGCQGGQRQLKCFNLDRIGRVDHRKRGPYLE